MSACLHVVLRFLSSLGWKYEPEQILPNEDRKAAVLREVNSSFSTVAEKNATQLKFFDARQKEINRRILKILKSCGGAKNLKDPVQIQTVANLMKAKKLAAGYILMIQKQDVNLFNNGAKLMMGSFMIEQNALLESNVKKLKSCGITDTAKIEKSMLKMELAMEQIDATINAVNTNNHKNVDEDAIEIPEVDLNQFAEELQQLEDEAAVDEVKQEWSNAGKPKQRSKQQYRREEEEPVEFDEYEKEMYDQI